MYLTTSQCVFVNISETMNIRYVKTYCDLLLHVSIEKKKNTQAYISYLIKFFFFFFFIRSFHVKQYIYTTSLYRQNTLLFLIVEHDVEYISPKLSCNFGN